MADLSFEDFTKPDVKISEISFAGKRGFVRGLSFDAQMEIAERFAGKEDEQASKDDMKAILAYTLCDSAGNLLFESIDIALKVLGNQSADSLLELFKQVQKINGLDVDEEVKN